MCNIHLFNTIKPFDLVFITICVTSTYLISQTHLTFILILTIDRLNWHLSYLFIYLFFFGRISFF